MITSVRLPQKLENELEKLANIKNITKSQIIKTSISNYIANYYSSKSSFDLGKDLFGLHGSGKSDLSSNRKKYLDQILNEKKSRR